jgi:hypothetical protein
METNKSYESDVLFQKLGNTWYAFTESDEGEMIFTSLPHGVDPTQTSLEIHETITEHVKKMARIDRSYVPEAAA